MLAKLTKCSRVNSGLKGYALAPQALADQMLVVYIVPIQLVYVEFGK